MNTIRQIPENLKAGLISIDSYENKTMCGRLWYGHQGEESHVDNLMQLLLLICKALGEMTFPEEYVKCKSFSPPDYKPNNQLCTPTEMSEPENGLLATFKLKIFFRQNASWQGTVTWTENKQEQTFRSALELIMLIDSALAFAEGFNSAKIG